MRPALSATGLIVESGLSAAVPFQDCLIAIQDAEQHEDYGQVVETMIMESTFSFGPFASAFDAFRSAFGVFAFDGAADGVDFEVLAELLIEADSSVPAISTLWPTCAETLLS